MKIQSMEGEGVDMMSLVYQQLGVEAVYSERRLSSFELRVFGPGLPEGLCGNRADHESHAVHRSTVGTFWCVADEARRLPLAAERAWRPR